MRYLSPENAAWHAACADGKLLLRTCVSCGRSHHYPRPICPLCGGTETAWQESAGLGTIYTMSFTRRADPPYCIAYVELDEGPIMLTRIIDAPFETLRIGQRVTLRMGGADGQAMPMFTPVREGI